MNLLLYCVTTIKNTDAMGCQFEIADLIKSKGGDYIFSLKGNQGNLNDDVRLYFKKSPEGPEWEDYKDVEKGTAGASESPITWRGCTSFIQMEDNPKPDSH